MGTGESTDLYSSMCCRATEDHEVSRPRLEEAPIARLRKCLSVRMRIRGTAPGFDIARWRK